MSSPVGDLIATDILSEAELYTDKKISPAFSPTLNSIGTGLFISLIVPCI